MIEQTHHCSPGTPSAKAERPDVSAPYHPHAHSAAREFAIDTGSGYQVRVVTRPSSLAAQVDRLVSDMYGARGLHLTPLANALRKSGQTTIAACRKDRAVGTLTLGVDAGEGLLADTLYRPQIDDVRAEGARVCEVTRLAMDAAERSPDLMAALFSLGFVLARHVHRMTDMFIEVHPRHAGYYERMLGYRTAGPVRICPRVEAPAVLMHLPLKHAEERIREMTDHPGNDRRNLYREIARHGRQVRAGNLLHEPAMAV